MSTTNTSGPRMGGDRAGTITKGRGARNGIRLASALAALLVGAGAAVAQPSEEWVAREYIDSQPSGYFDIGMDAAVWTDTGANPDVDYFFVVGKVQLDVGKSVLAVYKYEVVPDQFGAGEPAASAFFPPLASSPQYESGGVAIVVDQQSNAVYVTGYTRMQASGSYGNDSNYVTVKYRASDLATSGFAGAWAAQGSLPAGVRIYDGPMGTGNDEAVDVVVDGEGDVYVTGSSVGDGTGKDIVSLKYDGDDGDLSSDWSSGGGEAQGTRRYDFDDGDDEAAECGTVMIAQPQEEDGGYNLFVAGTSWSDETRKDIVVLRYSAEGVCVWNSGAGVRYDAGLGEDDVGTGLGLHAVDNIGDNLVVGGYSVMGVGSLVLGPGGMSLVTVDDTDYTALRLDPASGGSLWDAVSGDIARHWDGDGGQYGNDDYATDIVYVPGTYHPSSTITIYLTGYTRTGQDYDVGTVAFEGDDDGALVEEDIFDYAGGDDRGAAIQVRGGTVYVAGFSSQDTYNIHDYLLLGFSLGSSPPDWDVTYEASDDTNSQSGVAMALAGLSGDILVTGTAVFSGTGFDLVSVDWLDQ